ncbi:SAV_915 family protein [Streptomyces sp. NPDC020801]|uniref:SAV_915 family protein n=1 Tax=unclassified Streptomyces TaxID=2593676 RepID=UPI0037B535C6
MRSRILDYAEGAGPEPNAASMEVSPSPRSRLLDYAEAAPPERPATDGRPGPKPGVPPYHTPVFVPAHPRYVDARDADGRPARVPFIAYELFAHPTDADGTVAFAFTSPARLVAALGGAQPWIAASIGPLAEGLREHDVTVLLDPRVAPGQHNWQPEDLAAYAQEVR